MKLQKCFVDNKTFHRHGGEKIMTEFHFWVNCSIKKQEKFSLHKGTLCPSVYARHSK